jgi:hypothetical protein
MQKIGSRAQVMHGNARMTGGGLKKKDLKYNKYGKIVSKKMSDIAKKENRLGKFIINQQGSSSSKKKGSPLSKKKGSSSSKKKGSPLSKKKGSVSSKNLQIRSNKKIAFLFSTACRYGANCTISGKKHRMTYSHPNSSGTGAAAADRKMPSALNTARSVSPRTMKKIQNSLDTGTGTGAAAKSKPSALNKARSVSPRTMKKIRSSLGTAAAKSKPSALNKANDQIIVMTYNLSWGCMSTPPNTKNSTAIKLVEQCRKKSRELRMNLSETNICLNNIALIINGNFDSWDSTHHTKIKSLNDSFMFDFIATQESENWDKLKTKINNKYEAIVTTTARGLVKLATFYNKNKYTIKKSISFDLIPLRDGRLCHIIFCNNTYTSKKYAFINLHNGHGIPKDLLQFQFNENIKKNNCTDLFNSSTIIMGGDFNDHKEDFKDRKGPNYYINLELLTKKIQGPQPAKTCCTGDSSIRRGKGKDNLIGDYIIADAPELFIHDHFIPLSNSWYNANNYPTSDHLPYVAIIEHKG